MERHKVKVALYAILVKGDEVLLARRFNTGWQDGNYSFPSGHLELDETLAAGVVREAKEEIGIIARPEDTQLVHTMHRMNFHLDFYFEIKKWEGEPYNAEPQLCDDVSWFSLSNLPENMAPNVQYAIEQYQKGVSFSEFVK